MIIHKSKTGGVIGATKAGSTEIVEGNTGREFKISSDPEIHRQIGLILRQMYSDLPWAVVREYTANALDANRDAGHGKEPITLQLPTADNCEFVCKDHGPGMRFDILKLRLTGYGESDKRNRVTQIGGWGIGSKCGLGYTDAVIFESVYNYKGKRWRTTMLCFLDSEKNAKCKFQAHRLTTDPTGLTVRVPVEKGHIELFAKAVEKFAHSPELAAKIKVVKGSLGDRTDMITAKGLLKPAEVVAESKLTVGKFEVTARVYAEPVTWANAVTLLLNGVPYPCSLPDLLALGRRDCWYQAVGQSWTKSLPRIVLDFPPDCGINPTPSRESIMQTQRAAALVLSSLDTLARQTGPDAMWRTLLKHSAHSDFGYSVVAALRCSPPRPEHDDTPFDQKEWVTKELEAVRKLFGDTRWTLDLNGHSVFVPPKGWIPFLRYGKNGSRLVPVQPDMSQIKGLPVSTPVFPVLMATMSPARVKARKEDAKDKKQAQLIPPRLKQHVTMLSWTAGKGYGVDQLVLVEDPKADAATRESLGDCAVVDPTSAFYSWKPPERTKLTKSTGTADAARAKALSAALGGRAKQAFDAVIMCGRGNYETPVLHRALPALYATAKMDIPTLTHPYEELNALQEAATFALGPSASGHPYVLVERTPTEVEAAGTRLQSLLLWPKVVTKAEKMLLQRPLPVRLWLKAQPLVRVLESLTSASAIRWLATCTSAKSEALRSLAALVQPADALAHSKVFTNDDRWLGKQLRMPLAKRCWPEELFAATGDKYPWQIKSSNAEAHKLGSLLEELEHEKHPVIELLGLLAASEFDYGTDDRVDATIHAMFAKYDLAKPATAGDFPRLWTQVNSFKA